MFDFSEMLHYIVTFFGLGIGKLIHKLIFSLIFIGLVDSLEIGPHLVQGLAVIDMILLALADTVVYYLLGIIVIILPIAYTYQISGHIRAREGFFNIVMQTADGKGKVDIIPSRLLVLVFKKVKSFIFTTPVLGINVLDI